jgi:hypothetical protein
MSPTKWKKRNTKKAEENAHNNKNRKSTIDWEKGDGTGSRRKNPRNNKRGTTLKDGKEACTRKMMHVRRGSMRQRT